MRLRDKTVLVTGGASGLGAACVRRFAGRGALVVIADIDESGAALADELGDTVSFVRTDVTSPGSVQAAIDAAVERYGALHGNINCAGILGAARLLCRDGPHDLELFARTVQVNLTGTFNVVRLSAFAMQQNEPEDDGERGVVVNTASVAAWEGQIGQAAYSASKGGVASLTLPLARELARFGIRVVSIAPGVFRTPMVNQLPDKIRQSLEAQAVFPARLGEPEQYANLAQQIFENSMLNGCTLRLDGAVRLAAK